MPIRHRGNALKSPAPGTVGAVSGRRPFRPRRSREPGTRSWRYPSRSSKFACRGLPDVIRSQRSPYGTSLLGAGAVHHIRPCASSRMVRSATPPAPNGMDMRIGLVGKPGSARALSFAHVPIIAAKTTARGTRQSRRRLSRRPAWCERMVKPPSLLFFTPPVLYPHGDIRRSAVSVCPSRLWRAMS